MTSVYVAWFKEEAQVLDATRAAKARGMDVEDVYSPYPIHGIDEAMGLQPSRLTWVCCAFGLLGLGLALGFQYWVSAIDWPLNVGGKPFNSMPAFVPVAFELTVLIAALGTVAALFARTRLLPRARPRFMPEGVTRDRFALVVRASARTFDADETRGLLERAGADEIEVREEEAP